MCLCLFCFFFFQAEDGIRDIGVTGVQTCALPIYSRSPCARGQPGRSDAGAPDRLCAAQHHVPDRVARASTVQPLAAPRLGRITGNRQRGLTLPLLGGGTSLPRLLPFTAPS